MRCSSYCRLHRPVQGARPTRALDRVSQFARRLRVSSRAIRESVKRESLMALVDQWAVRGGWPAARRGRWSQLSYSDFNSWNRFPRATAPRDARTESVAELCNRPGGRVSNPVTGSQFRIGCYKLHRSNRVARLQLSRQPGCFRANPGRACQDRSVSFGTEVASRAQILPF